MTISAALFLVMIVLYSAGVYLLLDRSLTRILLGFLMVGNATNLLIFLSGGSFGVAPIYGTAEVEDMSDPLPQAFILTSIVITFAVSAFILALIYRAWRLESDGEDEVHDDDQDTSIARAEPLTTEEVTDEELALVEEFEADVIEDDAEVAVRERAEDAGPADVKQSTSSDRSAES